MFLAGNKKKMAALSEILEPRFVERFLIEENNSYEDLVKEIKNQFPGVRGCSLRSMKRFCSHHGIKKQVSVSDNTPDLVLRSAFSEVGPTYLLLTLNLMLSQFCLLPSIILFS